MKAISLWQPWASAMALGVKRIETRSWETKYRGPLAIHAAKKRDAEVRDAIETLIPLCPRLAGDLPYGAIVGACNLIACVPMTLKDDGYAHLGKFVEPSAYEALLTDLERAFGNYEPGRWAWITDSMIALPEPIPFRGAQGFFEWTPQEEAEAHLLAGKAQP
jgi:hypothetical protein